MTAKRKTSTAKPKPAKSAGATAKAQRAADKAAAERRAAADRVTKAEAVFGRMIRGATVSAACREENIRRSTFVDWVQADADLAVKYARARDLMLDHMADEVLEVSDDSRKDVIRDDEGNERVNSEFVQRSKLRVDSRKWLLSKLRPEQYGDLTKVQVSGALAVKQQSDQELNAQIAATLAKLVPQQDEGGGE
jgi:hypothetical protein